MKSHPSPDTDKSQLTNRQTSNRLQIAQIVREACIDAAREGFTDASIQGLCQEGAMEAAMSAIERLDLSNLLKKTLPDL